MKKIFLFLYTLLLISTFTVLNAQANTEDNMYYFFDDRIVSHAEDATLVLGNVEKRVTNASWLDQYKWSVDSDIPEWENRLTIMYPHVIYDENGISVDGKSPAKYKIWYHSYCTQNPSSDYKWYDYIIDKTNSRNVDLGDFENVANGRFDWAGYVLCYMESNDGVNWTRPNCGEFYYKKQNGEIIGTNIVLIGHHGAGVHVNTHPDAGNGEPLYIMATTGTAISWSDDGIHWEAPILIKDGNKTENYMPGDTHNQILWSPELERYVVISRGYIDGVRTVLQFTSTEDLKSIRDMAKLSTYEEITSYWTEPEHVLFGTPDAQPYSAPIIYSHNGYYIGVVSMADFCDNNEGIYQQVHAELIWSPDATNWSYIENGQPFIPNDETFAFEKGNDYGMIFCAAPVVTGEKSKIFYAATPELHYFNYKEIPENIKELMKTEIPRAVEAEFITRTTTLNFAEFTTDRYAGFKSEDGTVVTKKFRILGETLKFNAEGNVSVAILDENGDVIDGFSHGEFIITENNANENVMRWKGDLKAIEGREISFEFKLDGAILYTVSGDIEACEIVKLSVEDVVINEGDEYDITVKVIPCNSYSSDSLIYESMDKSVVLCNGDGHITAYSEGEAIVRVSTPDGKFFTDISVTVTAENAPLWSDDFEDGFSEWGVRDSSTSGFNDNAPYTYIDTNGISHSGNGAFGLLKKNKQVLIRKALDSNMNKVLNVWFYDDTSVTENRIMACAETGSTNRAAFGVYSKTSTENYTIWMFTGDSYIDTGFPRSTGWHQFTWDCRSGTYTDMYIDGVKVATNTNFKVFNQITLGWWTAAASTTNSFDDVTISDKLPWEGVVVKGPQTLSATADGKNVTLCWTNPENPLWYDSLVIVRNNDTYPESADDGEIIAEITDKSITSYVDMTDGTGDCFYAVFGQRGGVYSEGKFAFVSYKIHLPVSDKTIYRHNKNNKSDVTVKITMNGAKKLTKVAICGVALLADKYSFDNGTLILKKSYLDTLSVGEYTVTMNFDLGEINAVLIVTDEIFSEDFEYGFDESNITRIKDGSNWVTADDSYDNLKNAVIVESDNAHSGRFVFQNANSGIALVEKVFDSSLRKVVHVWFYDDGVSKENDTYVKVLQNGAPLVGIGIRGNSAQYSYLYYSGVYVNTGISRSEGWHLYSFDFRNGYPELYIDYVKVATLSGVPEGSAGFPMPSFNKVWTGWFSGSNSGCAFDDIIVTDSLYFNDAVEIKGTSLLLDGTIGIKTYFDIDEKQVNIDDVKLVTKISDSITQTSEEYEGLLCYDNEKKMYFTVVHIAPKDADNRAITHMLTWGESKLITPVFTVSEYITKLRELAETDEKYESALKLVDALEIYTANADKYFNKKSTDVVTADIPEVTSPEISGSAEGVSFHSSSLLLKGDITIRHYFEVAEGKTPVFKLDDKVLEPKAKNGFVYVDIKGISVEALDIPCKLTVSDSLDITFSALNYIKLAVTKEDTNLINLMNKQYNYYVEVKAYK